MPEPRIAVLHPDLGACAYYRLIWPAAALAAQGADVVARPLDIAAMATTRNGVERLVAVDSVDADVIVVQRPLSAQLADAVELWTAKGQVVIVDLDDNFDLVHELNVARAGTRHPQTNIAHLARACTAASLITVSTPALAVHYGRFGPITVVPNQIPEAWLDVPRRPEHAHPHDDIWVGWTGTLAVHPGDLEVTRGGVARAVAEAGATFAVVGDGRGVAKALGINDAIMQSGLVPLDEYMAHYAALDVAIVPLALTQFNQAKSWNKALESAGANVPAVISPTSENRRAAAKGIGVLARSYDDWWRQTRALIASPELRAERVGVAREAVGSMTVEANTDRWWRAWTRPLAQRKAG